MTVLQVLAVAFSLVAVCIAGLTLSLCNSLEWEVDALEKRLDRLEPRNSVRNNSQERPNGD